MTGERRYRSRSIERREGYRRDSSSSYRHSDHNGERTYERDDRDRGNSNYRRDENRRGDSDRLYSRDGRYSKLDKRARDDRRGYYRDDDYRRGDREWSGDRYDSRRDDYRGRNDDRNDRHTSIERSRRNDRDTYRDGKGNGYKHRNDRNRSPSQDSACSFGSRVSFGEDMKEKEEEAEELDEEALLMKSMGFGEFATTKNKEHLDSDVYAVAKRSKRQYRQYMNRRGGFNRPLSPTY
ncbi:hypothetical protein BgAZ_108660 [Babesia gibsoni]|uniref:U4/U6.U5 small nuclear ribonucleoprotein 27kDa protein domain-containing protein n=1 Tax=Babesia gibsoni TaxID=33632 RepID=A0AAD8PGA8_BABGI|nr:hypothetical protein BgAZ_108660 [Babesia gibsoni]